MERKYSLVHLSDISCPPPQMIRIAAEVGYDYVSLRTIPMGLPGEVPHDIARNKELLRETKRAIEDTGVLINDIENARIYDGVDLKAYEPSLEAAAELGVKHILSNIWTADQPYYTEKFSELCEMASRYGQTVNVEFVTWASVPDMKTAKKLILNSGCKNVGMVVDVLHFYRSRCVIEEIQSMPKEWFNFIHLCDAERDIPIDQPSLIHTGRAERLYPGEGFIDIKHIVEKLPPVVYGIEVPHLKRLKEMGYQEHAKTALIRTREYLGKKE